MPVQITIRDIPDEVRNELAARAAQRRQSMQEYLRGELERLASRPTIDGWLDRVRDRKAAGDRRLGTRKILSARDAGRR